MISMEEALSLLTQAKVWAKKKEYKPEVDFCYSSHMFLQKWGCVKSLSFDLDVSNSGYIHDLFEAQMEMFRQAVLKASICWRESDQFHIARVNDWKLALYENIVATFKRLRSRNRIVLVEDEPKQYYLGSNH